MSKKSDFTLLEELVLTVDKIGYDKTLALIRKSRSLVDDKDEVLKEYIIQQTCSVFSISKKDLLGSKSFTRKTDILAIISFKLREHLRFSQGRIASIIRRHDSVVSKYQKKISHLDENHIEDQILLDKINVIELSVREFKNKLIDNNSK